MGRDRNSPASWRWNPRHWGEHSARALGIQGCSSSPRLPFPGGVGPPRYAFVHGNWALANSAQGKFCGVDDEMQILAETGCYGDFTLPAPSSAQVRKINAIYECSLPLNRRAPHRRGRDLQSGRPPKIFPLIWYRDHFRLILAVGNTDGLFRALKTAH